MLFIIDRVHNTFGFKLNGDLKLGFDSFWVIICRLSHMHRFDNHFVRTHLSNHKCHFSFKSKFSFWSPRESTSLISSCWECNWLIAPAAILWQHQDHLTEYMHTKAAPSQGSKDMPIPGRREIPLKCTFSLINPLGAVPQAKIVSPTFLSSISPSPEATCTVSDSSPNLLQLPSHCCSESAPLINL